MAPNCVVFLLLHELKWAAIFFELKIWFNNMVDLVLSLINKKEKHTVSRHNIKVDHYFLRFICLPTHNKKQILRAQVVQSKATCSLKVIPLLPLQLQKTRQLHTKLTK